MSNSTAFVLVPGSFSPASFWDKVVPLLQKEGHEVHPFQLPSAGERKGKPATFEDDVDGIASLISRLAEEQKDVVLALNSYAGFPGTEATKGLTKNERAKEGKRGGLVALVYVASFLPRSGSTLASTMGELIPDSMANCPDDYMVQGPEAWKWIFPDFSEEDAKRYFSMMPNHSSKSFHGKLNHVGYKFVPTTVFAPRDDNVIPAALQDQMLKSAEDDGIHITKILPEKGGHIPMLTIPEELTRVLVGVIKSE
ncbi:alpha/beta-hydrolase [Atractiella rhizophila]|nr:alpha/beta-hydrolase [Atractiella rhizophila]